MDDLLLFLHGRCDICPLSRERQPFQRQGSDQSVLDLMRSGLFRHVHFSAMADFSHIQIRVAELHDCNLSSGPFGPYQKDVSSKLV